MLKALPLLFVLVFSLRCGFGQGEVLDLPYFLQAAYASHPDLVGARYQADQERNTLQTERSAVLPSLAGSASSGLNVGRSIDPTTNQFVENEVVGTSSFGLSSNLSLFEGFRIQRSIELQKLRLQAAEQGTKAARNAVGLSVAEAYFNAVIQQERLKAGRESYLAAKAQEELAATRYRAGALTKADLLRARSDAALQKASLVGIRGNYYTNLAALMILCGLPVDTGLQLKVYQQAALEQTFLPTELYENAEAELPEVNQARLNVEAARMGLFRARSGYSPSLSLSGNLFTNYSSLSQRFVPGGIETLPIGFVETSGETVLTSRSIGSVEDVPYRDQLDNNLRYGVSLNLNVPIYSQRQIRGQVASARISIAQAENNLESQRRNLRQTIWLAWQEAENAKAQREANSLALESSEEAYQLTLAQYEAGGTDYFTLVQARNNRDQARMQYITAEYQFLYNRLVLHFYAGEPIEEKINTY